MLEARVRRPRATLSRAAGNPDASITRLDLQLTRADSRLSAQYGGAPNRNECTVKNTTQAMTPASGRNQPISLQTMRLRRCAIATNGTFDVAAANLAQSGF